MCFISYDTLVLFHMTRCYEISILLNFAGFQGHIAFKGGDRKSDSIMYQMQGLS